MQQAPASQRISLNYSKSAHRIPIDPVSGLEQTSSEGDIVRWKHQLS